MTASTRRRVLAGLLALPLAEAASGAGGTIFIDPVPKEEGSLAVGPSLWSFPAYPGGRQLKFMLLPGIDMYSTSGVFVSTDNGVGWNLSGRDDLQAGVRLWMQLGRKPGDSTRLNGTEAIGPRLEKAGFVNYAPYDFLLLQSSVRYGSGVRGDGLLAELAASIGAPLGANGTLAFSLGSTWANQAYRQSYFGLTEEQALRSNRSSWQMHSGMQDTNFGLSAEYRLDPQWRLSGQWTRARLLGDAARSPITESSIQSMLSVTLWRAFK